uniref:Uncharacterized protein n=1 Tax=Anguilla anguilla TaxID=7936 RepID=A0A0E9SVA5_ANGAN
MNIYIFCKMRQNSFNDSGLFHRAYLYQFFFVPF